MSKIQASGLTSRRLRKMMSIILVVLILGMSALPVFAVTPQKTVNASATLAYNILGLKHNNAIQNFFIGTTYLYVTQRVNSTVYFSRLTISGNNATYKDEMTLTNCGHGQTCDLYKYNNVDHFYVSAYADTSTDDDWSRQVARIQYSAGKTYDYTELHRFTYMNCCTADGSSVGTTLRVDGGGNGIYTIFRTQTVEGAVAWAIYDTVALNQLLDSNVQVPLNGAGAKSAFHMGFIQTGSGIVRPNGSCQGFDMVGDWKIYTTGGAEGQTPGIAKMSNTGVYQTLVNVTNVGTHEIEGCKTIDSNVYFVIIPNTTDKYSTQKVYYVPESIF